MVSGSTNIRIARLIVATPFLDTLEMKGWRNTVKHMTAGDLEACDMCQQVEACEKLFGPKE